MRYQIQMIILYKNIYKGKEVKQTMVKCLVYLRGGLGDMFPFLSQRDKIKEEFKIDEFTYLFDSAYYQKDDIPAFKMNLQSMERLLAMYGISMDNKVPKELTSAWDLDFHCAGCHSKGPIHHNSHKEFMFGRKKKTIEFVMRYADILESDYIIDVAIPEHIYIWKMDYNKDFVFSRLQYVDRIVAKPELKQEEKDYIDRLLVEKNIVVQYGMRGYQENLEMAKEYLAWLKSQGYTALVIGFNYGFNFDDKIIDLTNGKLSFDGYLYLLEKAEKAMLYSSFFSFYRMYLGLDKKTIVYWAKRLGSWEQYIYPKIFENKQNIIIDSDLFGNMQLMEFTNAIY